MLWTVMMQYNKIFHKKIHPLKPLPSSSKKASILIHSIYPIRLSVGVYGEYNIQMNNSPGKVHASHSAPRQHLLQRANRHLRQQIHRRLPEPALGALQRAPSQGTDRVRNRVAQLDTQLHTARSAQVGRFLLTLARGSREDTRSVLPPSSRLRALLSQRQRDL